MVADLIRALLAAAAACVLPGYFWAAVLRPTSGLAERLTYSTVVSMATVPVVAIVVTRVTGGGITLGVAIASAAAVFVSGGTVFLLRGPAPGTAGPLMPRPAPIRDPRAVTALAVASVLAIFSVLSPTVPGALLLVIAAAVVVAGVLVSRASMAAPQEEAAAPAAGDGPALASAPRGLRAALLGLVIALTGFRAYSGVLLHDWPSIRGGDHYSHAVMAEQMLAHGSYATYLLYPPGLPALTAVISRICGLSPLALFPVLAPALLVVVALGAYALATRLWGWPYGLVAAALSGLVLAGAYQGFAEGRYPDLIAAYFLLVMTITALLGVFESPSWRSGALTVVVAGSVVLYHSVASLYLLLMMALVSLTALPYLLRKRERRHAGILFATLAGVAVISACYAAYIYNLGTLLTGHSATDKAVSITIGSQATRSPEHLLPALAPAVVWLGLFGVIAFAVSMRRLTRPPQVLAALTMVMWCVLMYVGSRTSLDGFPHRFERDLGAPLTVMAALAPGMILVSLPAWRLAERVMTSVAGVVAAAVVALMMLAQTVTSVEAASRPAHGLATRQVTTAGKWLAQHNTGGNIISTPEMGPGVSNRGVLAMGGYAGLQSYRAFRVLHPRSLPPAGRQPLLDSQEVLRQPGSCQSASILNQQDIRYVVLYRKSGGADLAGFAADPARYHLAFENPSVVIYAPSHGPCTGG